MTTAQTAFDLASGGFHVFPLRADGTPATKNGFKDATNDPYAVQDAFEKRGNYLIGVATGPSNLIVLDIDYKESPDGTVKDGFTTIEREWLDVPESFAYTSKGGSGRHIWYRVPDEQEYGRSMNYRGLAGVDRASGDGYIVFNGDTVPKYGDLTIAPEWLCDVKKAHRVSDTFEGTVKEWYDTLEPGAPNAPVRKAMERVAQKFADLGDDFSHGEIVEFQYEAVRLGAEGNPGVPELLELIEDKFFSRTGAHSRPEDEWGAEFNEALESGIRKAGESIALRKELPPYTLSALPDTIPSGLVASETPGTRSDFTKLLSALVSAGLDKATILTTLWNAPAMKDMSHDWGLVFVNKRIEDEMARRTDSTPVPVREEPEREKTRVKSISLVTDSERETAAQVRTVIDEFVDASERANGFVQPAYSKPLAWVALSLASGLGYVIPKNGAFGTNLWFGILGESGTAKSVSMRFFTDVANAFLIGGETNWNTGVGSPEGMEQAILMRDNQPTALVSDEAAAFYKNLLTKDWMQTLPHKMADWYMGEALGSQKINLKELRGKRAHTSFSFVTMSTTSDTLRVIDEDMFGTGFMARVAWIVGPAAEVTDERYAAMRTDLTKTGTSVHAISMGLAMGSIIPDPEHRTEVWGSNKAVKRLERAFKEMDRKAERHPKYRNIIQPSVIRLDQTLWKCAALLAIYDGRDEFDLNDALIALSYVEEWYRNLLTVSEKIAGLYQRDTQMIVDYVKEQGGRVSRKDLMKEFQQLISRTAAELKDRIDFTVDSGQLRAVMDNGQSFYELVE